MAPSENKAEECEPEVVMDGSGLDSKPVVKTETSIRCISGPAKENVLFAPDSDPKTEEPAAASAEDSMVPQLGSEPQPAKRRSICRLPRCLRKCRLPMRKPRSSSVAKEEECAKKDCANKQCEEGLCEAKKEGRSSSEKPIPSRGSVVTECGANADTPAQPDEKPKASKRCCSCKCLPKVRLRAPRCCSRSSKVSKASAETFSQRKEESKMDFTTGASVVPISSDKPLVNVPVVEGKPVDMKSPTGQMAATGGTFDQDTVVEDITCH